MENYSLMFGLINKLDLGTSKVLLEASVSGREEHSKSPWHTQSRREQRVAEVTEMTGRNHKSLDCCLAFNCSFNSSEL